MKRSGWPKRSNSTQPLTLGTWLDYARQALRSLPEEPSGSLYALAAKTLAQPAYWPLAHPEYSLTPEQLTELDHNLDLLLQGEPLPYILNNQAFFGLDFYVTPDVLIPRPETELLVEIALDCLSRLPDTCLAADVGTGSGCIAIALAHHYPLVRMIATDLSFKSLLIARENCRRHELSERIALLQTDLLAGVQARFDLICANLPYIPSHKLENLAVARHEPLLALDGGPAGLDAIARLLDQSRERLNPGGLMLLEMEFSQSEAIRELIHGIFPAAGITIVDDLNRLPRLAIIES